MTKKIFSKVINNHGDMVHKWSQSDFGTFVSTGLQAGNVKPMLYVGRVMQVRLEAGEFGSDLVLIRHADGTLGSHENQCFFRVKDEFLPELKSMFKDSYEHDSASVEYTICNKNPETGFIIPSPYGPEEYTPMREVRSALYNKFDELLKM